MIVVISLVAGGLAYSQASIDKSTENIMSPQGVWYRYYNTSEGQTLTFTDWLNETGWIILDPCQDSQCWAPDETISPPLPIPAGSTFPFRQSDPAICNPSNNYCQDVINYVESVFNWTPNCSQAGNYTFKSEHYIDSLWVDTIIFHVNVTNVNRAPTITSYVPVLETIPVGQSWNLQLNATDLDKTQCGDDQVHWSYSTNYTGSRTFNDNGNGTAIFSMGPVNTSNIGSYKFNFTAYDNFGGTANKSVIVNVYKPANNPSCYFDKRTGRMVCA